MFITHEGLRWQRSLVDKQTHSVHWVSVNITYAMLIGSVLRVTSCPTGHHVSRVPLPGTDTDYAESVELQ